MLTVIAVVAILVALIEGIGLLLNHFVADPTVTNIVQGALYALAMAAGLLTTAFASIIFASTSNPVVTGLFDAFGGDYARGLSEFNVGMGAGLVVVAFGTVLFFAQCCAHVSALFGGYTVVQPNFMQWNYYGVYLFGDGLTFGAVHSFFLRPPIVPQAAWATALTFVLFAVLPLPTFSLFISLVSSVMRHFFRDQFIAFGTLVKDLIKLVAAIYGAEESATSKTASGQRAAKGAGSAG